MGQMRVASILAAAFLGLSPGARHHAQTQPDPSPSPTASFAATSPILNQQSPRVWKTTVLVDSSPSCLGGLKYQLVTASPNYVIDGAVAGMAPVPPAGTAVRECGNGTGQFVAVSLVFKLKKPFQTVPLGATLVVEQPNGTATPTAEMVMIIHRVVSQWQYLWIPMICGGILVVCYLALVGTVPLFNTLRNKPAHFWTQPMYASAAWTFQDSWATNIATAGTTIAAVLTGLGTVTTLLPGVQLDRYAVLIGICGAIIVAAPLVFGIAYTLFSRSRPQVPDNATLKQKPPQGGQPTWTITVPGGASFTLPGGAKVPASNPPRQVELKAGATLPVPPGATITVNGGTPVFPGDASIVLNGATKITVDKSFTASGDAIKANPPHDQANPPHGQANPPSPGPVKLVNPVTIEELVADDAVTLKIVGFAYVEIPRSTEVLAPGARKIIFRNKAALRVPLGSNVIVSDMRSLVPAAMTTMFGIGAELGLLGVLAGWLSVETGGARVAVVAVTVVIAVVLLWYAWSTTHALKDARPGSALSPDSHVSATL